MLVTFAQHELRQQSVPKSSSMWSHKETAMTKHSLDWSGRSRSAKYTFKQLMNVIKLFVFQNVFKPNAAVM